MNVANLDQWILGGVGGLFLIWMVSNHPVWLPWCRRHPAATDLLIIFGSSWFILSPLTQFGAPGGHDFYFHVCRVAELDWLWRDGVYYGRWTPDFNHGFGYPLLNFYPPVIYYLAQIPRVCGASVLDALNWVAASGVWLSGGFMYLLGREFWGRHGGVVCAVAYLYAPYRLVNLYVRGAIPEFYAMTLMPLVFWSFSQLVRTRQRRYVVIGAIAYGLLIPTHNVTAVFVTLTLIGYSAFLLLEDLFADHNAWQRTLRKGLALLLTALLGIGLTAVYWLPATVEKQFVKVSSLYTGYHDVAVHFVYFAQFFSRFWGYGGSGEGPEDGMSFQLGLAHVILAGLALFVVAMFRRRHPRQRNHALFAVVLLAVLMMMMMSVSLPLWRMFPLLGFISFPWRLLSITAFALSFLCGGVFLVNFDDLRCGRWRLPGGNWLAQGLCLSFLLLFTVGYCRPGGLLPFPDAEFARAVLQKSAGTALNDEYLPIWAKDFPPRNIKGGEMQVISGIAELAAVKTTMLSYQVTLAAQAPATVRIGTVYFPGWNAYLDGQPAAVQPEPATGLVTVAVPQGRHIVAVRFEDTGIRQVGQYLSWASLGILCGFIGSGVVKRRWFSRK